MQRAYLQFVSSDDLKKIKKAEKRLPISSCFPLHLFHVLGAC